MGAADLEVVAEDAVVADLEAAQAGGFAFAAFEAGDPALGFGGGVENAVEFGAVAGADDAFAALGDGAFDEGAGFGAGVEGVSKIGEGRLLVLKQFAQAGDGIEGRGEVAYVRGGDGAADEAVGEAFEIADSIQGGLDTAAQGGVVQQRLDAIKARFETGAVDQGAVELFAQAAGAHGGVGTVEDGEEAALAAGVAAGGFEFKIAAGEGVQLHEVGGAVDVDAGEDMQGGGVGVFDVAQQDADGVGGERAALQAQAFQVADLEVPRDHFPGGGGITQPGLVVLGDSGTDFAAGKAQGEGFASADAGEFAGEGVARGFAGSQIAGGDVGVGQTARVAIANRHRQVVVGFGLQPVLIDDRAGGDDASDLALDEATADLSDLLADGDAQAGLDEATDVGGGGVVGDAAHGHPVAFAELARGEDDLEDGGGAFGVFVEHLVEVAEAKEQDRVGLLLFYVKKLTPQGRQFRLGWRRPPPLTHCRTKTELRVSLAPTAMSPLSAQTGVSCRSGRAGSRGPGRRR